MIETDGPLPDSCEAFTKEAFYGFEWKATPLGPVDAWPLELRHAAEWMLDTAQPMFLIWGEERLLLFNGAFCSILGGRFMEAMAVPVQEIWSPVWDDIKGYVDGAFAGKSCLVENVPLRTWASDFKEARHFTFAYSPLRAMGGRVVGAVCIATDTSEACAATQRVREERDRLQSSFDQAPVFLALGSAADLRFSYATGPFIRSSAATTSSTGQWRRCCRRSPLKASWEFSSRFGTQASPLSGTTCLMCGRRPGVTKSALSISSTSPCSTA